MSKEIFISHRSLDHAIVTELVQYMENIGIESSKIMYTSADYTGAQFELGKEVKEAISEAKLFIIIMSNDYYESIYCCNELGYIWATNKETIVFGLAEINNPKDYKGFVNDWVLRRLNNPKHIDFLYDQISNYSKYEIQNLQKLNTYKERYLEKISSVLVKCAVNKKPKQHDRYQPEQIIEINSLIISNYYGDKELMLFKYLKDTNCYIWGISENLKCNMQKWEKNKRYKPILSDNLEPFLIMLLKKGYLESKTISRKEWVVQDAVGQNDTYSKQTLAMFGTDEKGESKHNYFEMKEPLFRAIIRMDNESIDFINSRIKQYKVKWYKHIKRI